MTEPSQPEPTPTTSPSKHTITDYFNLASDSATTALANLRPYHFHDRVLLLPIIEQTNIIIHITRHDMYKWYDI